MYIFHTIKQNNDVFILKNNVSKMNIRKIKNPNKIQLQRYIQFVDLI